MSLSASKHSTKSCQIDPSLLICSYILQVPWKGPQGIPGKGIGKNTLKTPWNSLNIPWKHPENPWNSWHSALFPYALCGYALCTSPTYCPHRSDYWINSGKGSNNFKDFFWIYLFQADSSNLSCKKRRAWKSLETLITSNDMLYSKKIKSVKMLDYITVLISNSRTTPREKLQL